MKLHFRSLFQFTSLSQDLLNTRKIVYLAHFTDISWQTFEDFHQVNTKPNLDIFHLVRYLPTAYH